MLFDINWNYCTSTGTSWRGIEHHVSDRCILHMTYDHKGPNWDRPPEDSQVCVQYVCVRCSSPVLCLLVREGAVLCYRQRLQRLEGSFDRDLTVGWQCRLINTRLYTLILLDMCLLICDRLNTGTCRIIRCRVDIPPSSEAIWIITGIRDTDSAEKKKMVTASR